MKSVNSQKTKIITLSVLCVIIFNSGCNEDLKVSKIYRHAITGAIIGGIVGHQSHEEGEGAAIGAALFGVGELFSQIDDDGGQQKAAEHGNNDKIKEIYIIQVHNSNGSITPVELTKQGNVYIGPKGEQYEKLPTEEDLKAYGF